MKSLKSLKVLAILLLAFVLVGSMVSTVYGAYTWNVDQFDGKGDTTVSGKATSIMGAIIDVVRIVATGVAIIMIIAVAMKYMTAAPGDRADIKKHAVPFVVGAVVLFGATGILTIIKDFAGTI